MNLPTTRDIENAVAFVRRRFPYVEAEDVVQDALVSVLCSAPPGDIGAALMRQSKFRAIDGSKKRETELRRLETWQRDLQVDHDTEPLYTFAGKWSVRRRHAKLTPDERRLRDRDRKRAIRAVQRASAFVVTP